MECVSAGAAMALLSWVRKLVPNTTIFDIIYMQCKLKPGSKEELAISILTALAVHHIWMNRSRGGMNAWDLKTETVGYTSILMKTKFSASTEVIYSLIQ